MFRLSRFSLVLLFGVLLVSWVLSLGAFYQWCHAGCGTVTQAQVHLRSQTKVQSQPSAQIQTQAQAHAQEHTQTHAQTQVQARTQTSTPTQTAAQTRAQPRARTDSGSRGHSTSTPKPNVDPDPADPCSHVVVPSSPQAVLDYMRRAAPCVFDGDQVASRYPRASESRRWRLYYGVLYNREESQLLTMLHTLHHVVDYFVVVESAYTLTNKPKPLYLPLLINRTDGSQPLARFFNSGQLIYHVIREPYPPHKFQYWEAEIMQRDTIGQVISNHPGISPDDIIIVTDADELLDPRLLQFIKQYHVLNVGQAIAARYRWTFFGYMWQHHTTWDRACIVTKATLDTGVSTHGVRNNVPNRIVLFVGNASESTWGGWHCSWCLPTHLLEMKMKSYAHQEVYQHFKHQRKNVSWYRETGTYFSGVRDTYLVGESSFVLSPSWDRVSGSGGGGGRAAATLAPQYAICQKDHGWRWLFHPQTPGPE